MNLKIAIFYSAFPSSEHELLLPKNQVQYRAFLIRHLDDYLAHEKTFELGTSVHGRGHILRTFIFATVMCNILGKHGILVDKRAILCAIACHDLGRKGSNQDLWEDLSAALAIKKIREDFIGEPIKNLSEKKLKKLFNCQDYKIQESQFSLGQAYELALAKCIYKAQTKISESKTLEAELVNAADSLDIGRVVEFEEKYFTFLQESFWQELIPQTQQIRKSLIIEARLLQKLTNPWCAKQEEIQVLTKHLAMSKAENQELLAKNYQFKIDKLYSEIEYNFAQEWNLNAENYVIKMENTIQNNGKLLPLIYEYYK